MSAYDLAAWTDFANTVAGVPSRAAATLGLTVAILLTAIFVATPGHSRHALSIEMAVLGVATANAWVLVVELKR